MIKVTEFNDEIVIRDIPLMQWVWAAFFAVFAGWFANAWLSFKDYSDFTIDTVDVLIPVVSAVYAFFTTTITTTTIDRAKQTISVKKRGILKNSWDGYLFSEVEDGLIKVNIERYRRGTPYSIRLPLKGGRAVDLAAPRSLRKHQYSDIVEQANKYLPHDSNDFKLTIIDDE